MTERNIRIGKRYRVCFGSGLDSGRVGRVTNPGELPHEFFMRIEPGRYRPFDSSTEALLIDEEDSYFTMFKHRLEEVDDRITT